MSKIEIKDPVLENILALIGEKSGAKTQFTRSLGFCASTIGDWKSGKSKSYTKHLPKIADYFGVSVDTLLGKAPAAPRAGIQLQPPHARNVFAAGELHYIPVIGHIRAGYPIVAAENIEAYEIADVKSPEEYFYLRVEGDSMVGAGISDGSLVLVRRQNYAEQGQIVACLVDGESATLKRYKRKRNTVLLMPENIGYEPIVLPVEAFENGEAAILGVAVEVKKKLLP